MDKNQEKFCQNITSLSGILIPISLTSMILIGVKTATGFIKNLLMFTLPIQTIFLILVLIFSLPLYQSKKSNNVIKLYLKISYWSLIIGLILIAGNHLLILFSS